jgi:hypothetical protein
VKEFEGHLNEGNSWLGPRTVKDNSSVKVVAGPRNQKSARQINDLAGFLSRAAVACPGPGARTALAEAFVGIDAAKLRTAVAIAEEGRDGEVRYLAK